MRRALLHLAVALSFFAAIPFWIDWPGSYWINTARGWERDTGDRSETQKFEARWVSGRVYVGTFTANFAGTNKDAGVYTWRSGAMPRWSETMGPSLLHSIGFGWYSVPGTGNDDKRWQYRGLMLPGWFPALVATLPPWLCWRRIALVLWADLWRRRTRAGTCPTCGYDLRGTPDRCPECGKEIAVGTD